MRSLTAGQLAILASNLKSVSWLFDVYDSTYSLHKWSTKAASNIVGEDLNTRTRRASSVSILLPFMISPPLPDIDLDAGDRAHIAHRYSRTTTAVPYGFRIVNFDGLTIARPKSESRIMPPSEITFSLTNKGNEYSPTDFEGSYLILRLMMSDTTATEEEIRSWKFLVKKVEGAYQMLHFTCEDFFTQYIEGMYPGAQYLQGTTEPVWDTTGGGEEPAWDTDWAWAIGDESVGLTYGVKVKDIFPAAEGDIEDDVCIPMPFGAAYVPIRSAYISADRYYVIGPTVANGAAVTYTINAVRSPRDYSVKVSWDNSHTFTQSTATNVGGFTFRVFQAIIAPEPGPHTDNGLFGNGDHYYDMPTEFARSDTATITNPADVIAYVLKDMGVIAGDIDAATFAAAGATYDTWGLAFNGAFWKVVPREKALTLLLAMCHSTLVISEKVELYILDSTSQKAITAADILSGGDGNIGTFSHSAFTRTLSDCGNVAYSPTDDSQDIGVNALVAAKASKMHIDPEVFEMPFVSDATVAANITRLQLQRKLLTKSEMRFSTKATVLALDPGDFITVSDDNYGGTTVLIIDSMRISKDLAVDMVCTGYSDTIQNYSDL